MIFFVDHEIYKPAGLWNDLDDDDDSGDHKWITSYVLREDFINYLLLL